jgi:hypothetical protein
MSRGLGRDTSKASSTSTEVIMPRRFGLKMKPPRVVLEYTRGGQLRHYEVHLKDHDLEKVRSVGVCSLMPHITRSLDAKP